MIGLCALASAWVRADQAACDKLQQANSKTRKAGLTLNINATGYAFAQDTPEIYGSGTKTCSYVRDEAVDGQAAEVYREQYKSKAGNTDALIWISKSSGLLLKEEEDGDVPGKGKGHLSGVWSAGAQRGSASESGGGSSKPSASVRMDGKLPMYPHARNLNDIPASVIERGAPMVLETADSVTTVDAWYKTNASKPCTRSAADQGVKYACPGGSIMIYGHEGKTQIAFVPTL